MYYYVLYKNSNSNSKNSIIIMVNAILIRFGLDLVEISDQDATMLLEKEMIFIQELSFRPIAHMVAICS